MSWSMKPVFHEVWITTASQLLYYYIYYHSALRNNHHRSFSRNQILCVCAFAFSAHSVLFVEYFWRRYFSSSYFRRRHVYTCVTGSLNNASRRVNKFWHGSLFSPEWNPTRHLCLIFLLERGSRDMKEIFSPKKPKRVARRIKKNWQGISLIFWLLLPH